MLTMDNAFLDFGGSIYDVRTVSQRSNSYRIWIKQPKTALFPRSDAWFNAVKTQLSFTSLNLHRNTQSSGVRKIGI